MNYSTNEGHSVIDRTAAAFKWKTDAKHVVNNRADQCFMTPNLLRRAYQRFNTVMLVGGGGGVAAKSIPSTVRAAR